LAVVVLALSSPGTAYAQNPAAAEALFEQARAAMAAGSFDIACARFRDSDKLDPAVGTRFNLADCEERRGRVATAWSLFRGVLAELAQDDDRRPIAEQRARALEPRMPYLTLLRTAETPEGVRVRVDGIELGEGSLGVPLPMDPGAHVLQVLVPGDAKERRSRFTLTEGEHAELPISAAKSTDRVEAPAEPEPNASGAGVSRRTWGYAAGGVGAAGVLLGTVAGVVTLNKKRTADANCSDRRMRCNAAGVEANESGKTWGALSGVGFGLGVVGLAAGAYLLLTEEPSAAHSSIPLRTRSVARRREGAVLNVNPSLDPSRGSGFVALSGSF
jgi:hypothetical protein